MQFPRNNFGKTTGRVVKVVVMLVVLAALLALSVRAHGSSSHGASQQSAMKRADEPAVGWSFQFVVRPVGGNGTVVMGSEYFSADEQRVRRDWSQGAEVLPDCPLPAEAGGSELVNVAPGDTGTQHVLFLAKGVVSRPNEQLVFLISVQWACREQPIPRGTPRPQGGLLSAGTRGENATVRGEACFLLTGFQGRPGPACSADDSWTAWVSWDALALLQLNTSCFVMDAFGWVRRPRSVLACF